MDWITLIGKPSEIIEDPWVQRVIIDATKESSPTEVIIISIVSTVLAAGILYLIRQLWKKFV